MNIVFLDEYSLGGIDLSRIKQLGNYTGYEKTTPGEIAERCIDADIVITNKVPLRAEAIKVLPQTDLHRRYRYEQRRSGSRRRTRD